MTKILVIKTSSMGDVVHCLPVLHDIRKHLPLAEIDWVVEEGFVDIIRLHPAVRRIIPVALRRWRKQFFSFSGFAHVWREWFIFKQQLRAEHYDWIIDLQGLFKSAVLARLARGTCVGFTRQCARESIASWFYQITYSVNMQHHAIERGRELAAQAVGYPSMGLPIFDLIPPPLTLPELPTSYAVILHATSRPEKTWPQISWQHVIAALAKKNITSILPWGSKSEQLQAQRLAQLSVDPQPIVAPKLTLMQAAALLAHAKIVIGLDTGLMHLAAAFNQPTVALFVTTPRWRFAPYWNPNVISLGAPDAAPQIDQVLNAMDQLLRNNT